MRRQRGGRRAFLTAATVGITSAISGCSTVRQVAEPAVRSADDVDSDLPTGDELAKYVPNVSPDEFLDRELWIRVRRRSRDGDAVLVAATDVRYSIRRASIDHERARRRKEFLGRTPVDVTKGYDVYRSDGFEGVSPDGRIRTKAKAVELGERELFDRCLAAATADDSLLSHEDVRTLTERVQARDAINLYLLDGDVYGDERMRVPGARATAIGDSYLDEETTLREVAGLYSAGDVDADAFERWVVSNVVPAVQSTPTVVRDGRVMRAYWENAGERPTPKPTPDVPLVRVWVAATEDGWRFWYPDEGVEDRDQLVVPADARLALDVTSFVDIVSLEIPALDVRTDALPKTFTPVRIEPSEPAEREITCTGPCQWEYDASFSAPFRVVEPAAYREWLSDPSA